MSKKDGDYTPEDPQHILAAVALSLSRALGSEAESRRSPVPVTYAILEPWYRELCSRLLIFQAIICRRDEAEQAQVQLGHRRYNADGFNNPFTQFLGAAIERIHEAVEPMKGDCRFPGVKKILEPVILSAWRGEVTACDDGGGKVDFVL